MKRILKIILSFALLGVALYQFGPVIFPRLLSLEQTYIAPYFAPAPCTRPIPYILGTFDTRFNISQKYFLSALLEAEAIWEKPYGKELFIYSPEDTSKKVLSINLIYDFRQEATAKLASLGIVVEDNRSSYDTLKARFTALQKSFEKEKSDFNARLLYFNQRKQVYEAEVVFWNKKKGAPEAEYNQLEQERLAINAESVELQKLGENMNSMADEINALVVVLNRLVDSLNLSVDKYNTTNNSRGESFEQGVYSTDGVNINEIDIYEFSNRIKLVRVLAHELGHALGLEEHVEDPKSIMYHKNQSNSGVLTNDDLTALYTRCQKK